MKLLILGLTLSLTIAFGLSQNSYADSSNPAVCCQKKLDGGHNAISKNVLKIAKYDPTKEYNYSTLAEMLCTQFMNTAEEFERRFFIQVKSFVTLTTGIPDPTLKQMVYFLNEHKDQLRCGRRRRRRNYMKRAIDQRVFSTLYLTIFKLKFYFKDKAAKIDINAVDLVGVDGNPETVLDYMDYIIREKKKPKSTLKRLKRVRRQFIKLFDAKKFIELPKDVQEKYKELVKHIKHRT